MRLTLLRFAVIFGASLLLLVTPARAADPPLFTAPELDQMLAPIALFPDALLSQVLMAATYPSDVALAVDWAFANRQLKGDAAVQAVQHKPWDPSVQSLVAFPQVLAMLGENPAWVQNLGDAFLEQPNDVMDSVQFLRAKAMEAGNLRSNAYQVITVEAAPPRRHRSSPSFQRIPRWSSYPSTTPSMSSAHGGTPHFPPSSFRRRGAGDSAGA